MKRAIAFLILVVFGSGAVLWWQNTQKTDAVVEQAGAAFDLAKSKIADVAETAEEAVRPIVVDTDNAAAGNSIQQNLAALLDERETWGMPDAAPVAAPLAAGASSKLDLPIVAPVTPPTNPDVIINALQAKPVAEVAPIDATKISGAMAALLAEREGWGSAPTSATADVRDMPTPERLAALLVEREAWGLPDAKDVAAPLAAGAVSPLQLPTVAPVTPPANPDVKIYSLQETPAAVVAPIEQAVISSQLQALLSEREGWGTEPGPVTLSNPEALEALLDERDGWGQGIAKDVASPLAKGAKRKLDLPQVAAVTPPSNPDVILNASSATPIAETTAVDASTITSQMAALLTERDGWGTEPSPRKARSTESVAALIEERDAWGLGKAKKVASPLAKGAKSPLKLPTVAPVTPPANPNVIVNGSQATPVAEMTAVEPSEISSQLAALLSEREGWGTEPSSGETTIEKTVASTTPDASIVTAESIAVPQDQITTALQALLAERDGWGTAPSASAGAETVVADASTAVYLTAEDVAVGSDQIDSELKKLLAERDGWGTAPSGAMDKTAAVDASGDAATACETALDGITKTGIIQFDTASADISRSSNATLDQIADAAKGCSGLKIRIEGHTDSQGAAAFNKSLSQQRADKVLSYLASAGVDRGQMTSVGFGEEKPIASNSNRASRAKNRRIEFNVSTE